MSFERLFKISFEWLFIPFEQVSKSFKDFKSQLKNCQSRLNDFKTSIQIIYQYLSILLPVQYESLFEPC